MSFGNVLLKAFGINKDYRPVGEGGYAPKTIKRKMPDGSIKEYHYGGGGSKPYASAKNPREMAPIEGGGSTPSSTKPSSVPQAVRDAIIAYHKNPSPQANQKVLEAFRAHEGGARKQPDYLSDLKHPEDVK